MSPTPRALIGPSEQQVLAVLPLPVDGVWQTVPASQLPPTALRDALNVVLQAGTLRNRPGVTLHNSTSLTIRAQGALAYRNASNNPIPLVATRQRIWKFESGVWSDLSDQVLTAAIAQLSRWTVLETGGVVYAVHTNGQDAVRQWNGSAGTVSQIAAAPLWTDLMTIDDRIVGIKPPYEVSWGEPLSMSVFPALNTRNLAESPDPARACRALGPFQGVIYKEESLWLLSPTGLPGSRAFRIERFGAFPGPAGPAAVVEHGGIHYYFSWEGRLGAFDGMQHQWVADGVWSVIQADLDKANADRVFGWADETAGVVYFAYPRTGDAGALKGLVALNIPRPKFGIPRFAAFPGRLMVGVSAAVTIRLTDNVYRTLLFVTDTDKIKSYEFAGASDDGANFSVEVRSPLSAGPGGAVYRLQAVELFAERSAGYGTITVKPVTSNILDTPGGTVGTTGTDEDLTDTPIKAGTPLDATGRFLGFKVESDSSKTLRYQGARLLGHRLE